MLKLLQERYQRMFVKKLDKHPRRKLADYPRTEYRHLDGRLMIVVGDRVEHWTPAPPSKMDILFPKHFKERTWEKAYESEGYTKKGIRAVIYDRMAEGFFLVGFKES